jgi:hypothetical protein
MGGQVPPKHRYWPALTRYRDWHGQFRRLDIDTPVLFLLTFVLPFVVIVGTALVCGKDIIALL